MKTIYYLGFVAPKDERGAVFNFEGDDRPRAFHFNRNGHWGGKVPDAIADYLAAKKPKTFALNPPVNLNFGGIYPKRNFTDLTAAAIRNNPVEAQAWLKRLMRDGNVVGDEKQNMLARRLLEADAAVSARALAGRKRKDGDENPDEEGDATPTNPETPPGGAKPAETNPAPAAPDGQSPLAALGDRILNLLLSLGDPADKRQWNKGGARAEMKMKWLEEQFTDDGVDRKHLDAAYARLPDWPADAEGKPLKLTRGNFAEWRKTHPPATLDDVAAVAAAASDLEGDTGRAAGQ